MTRKSAGIIRAFPPEAGSEKDSPELPVCIHCVAVGRFERNLMTRFISELAGTLVPYVPGEQPKDKKYVKLNTNENPYPRSPAVLRAIRKETENLRLYPDPDADAAREAAAAIDSFRFFYPDVTGAYSWWSYIGGARSRNAGWRIDYFIVSEKLRDRMIDTKIHSDIMGSDHCPVELDIRAAETDNM